jgi:hypothetical protein
LVLGVYYAPLRCTAQVKCRAVGWLSQSKNGHNKRIEQSGNSDRNLAHNYLFVDVIN